MPNKERLSPCCGAPSEVRNISLREGVFALRCEKCAQLRVEPIAAERKPKLRLIVNR